MLAALLVGAALLFVGCSQNRSAKEDASEVVQAEPVFKVEVDLDKKTYRVGDMVQCQVRVINQTTDDLLIVPPMARRLKSQSNIDFYYGFKGAFDVRRVVPVLPDAEDVKKLGTPPPEPISGEGQLKPRDFFFTTITSEPGTYQFQAHFMSSLHVRTPGRNIAYSVPVEFRVKDKVALRRDEEGMVLADEAVRVAKDKYGKLVRDGYAMLVKNDKGLWDWRVTLEKMPSDVRPGEEKLIAYNVSPYGGFVREENVMPFLKPKREDPEIQEAPVGSKLRRPGGRLKKF